MECSITSYFVLSGSYLTPQLHKLAHSTRYLPDSLALVSVVSLLYIGMIDLVSSAYDNVCVCFMIHRSYITTCSQKLHSVWFIWICPKGMGLHPFQVINNVIKMDKRITSTRSMTYATDWSSRQWLWTKIARLSYEDGETDTVGSYSSGSKTPKLAGLRQRSPYFCRTIYAGMTMTQRMPWMAKHQV